MSPVSVAFRSTRGESFGLRGSLRHRRLSGHHRKLRAALAAAAILAQVHLFFVVELHHHDAPLVFSGGQSKATVQLAQFKASAKSDVICAACMLCRQGAIRPASSTLLPSRDLVAQNLSLRETFKYARLLPSRVTSRAPPLS